MDEIGKKREIITDRFSPKEKEIYDCGFDLGEALTELNMVKEARIAYEKGEIELWLEYHSPKSWEDWEKFNQEHGSFEEVESRWTDGQN